MKQLYPEAADTQIRKDSKIGENMCSRYYIDSDMMEEISRVVQNIDGRDPADNKEISVRPMSHRSLDSQNMDWNWVYADGDIEQENIRNLG